MVTAIRPHTAAPAGAVDCHHHIYDRRYPADPRASLKPGDYVVADYLALRRRLGTQYSVLVQPSTYGMDNRCMLDALAAFGGTARGIAVVDAVASEAQLADFHDRGVRGIRLNLGQPGAPDIGAIDILQPVLRELGWHVQIHAHADRLAAIEDLLSRLTVPVVFDHTGRLPLADPAGHPAFRIIGRLLREGRGWLKLSGVYLDSRIGPPSYADTAAAARAFIALAPERLVWGSDWPHPSATAKPDDAMLFDLLAEWSPDEGVRRRILTDNPAALYGFPTP